MEKLMKKGRSSHKSSDKFVRGRVVKRYVVGGTFQVCYMRERRERSSSKFLHADCPRDYGRSSFLMNGLGEIYLTPPPDTPFPHTAWIRRRSFNLGQMGRNSNAMQIFQISIPCQRMGSGSGEEGAVRRPHSFSSSRPPHFPQSPLSLSLFRLGLVWPAGCLEGAKRGARARETARAPIHHDR